MAGIPNPGLQFFPLARGNVVHLGGLAVGVARLPTDPVGTFTLTLHNVVRGSRYRIERIGDASLATPTGNATGVVPAGAGDTTDLEITLDYYAAGNANNDLAIKVRKASESPYYRPFDSQAEARAGAVDVFVSQQLDE